METLLTDDQRIPALNLMEDPRRGADRRTEIRMASRSGPATLCVAARPPINVQIRDVSRSGLGLTTPCPLLVGSNVVVVCGGLTINGTIRHCRERVSGEYFAGVRIARIISTSAGKEI